MMAALSDHEIAVLSFTHLLLVKLLLLEPSDSTSI